MVVVGPKFVAIGCRGKKTNTSRFVSDSHTAVLMCFYKIWITKGWMVCLFKLQPSKRINIATISLLFAETVDRTAFYLIGKGCANLKVRNVWQFFLER